MKSWFLYVHLRRRWCILLYACLLVGLWTFIADPQLLVIRIIQITWLLRLQLSSLYCRSLSFCRPETGGGAGQDHYPLYCWGWGYFHKDFNCYICIDAAAAEWHITWFICRSKQLFPLLYSQMLFYVTNGIIFRIKGHLTINRASFPSILIIRSTYTFESKFAFIE